MTLHANGFAVAPTMVVQVEEPGAATTVYAVTGSPPLSAGGVHVMATCAFPALAPAVAGAPGTDVVPLHSPYLNDAIRVLQVL